MQNSFTEKPRRTHLFSCLRCYDIGVWRTPQGDVQPCPVVQIGLSHGELSPAAKMIVRATDLLRENNIPVHSLAFDIARNLSYYPSESPAQRTELLRVFFSYTRDPKRKLMEVIEELRKVWLLPVGSRKEEPSGYWIITDADDFNAWVKRATAAPITQLSTIHRVAKRNFPVFAEQLELEFFSDLQADPSGPDVTFAERT